MESYRLNQSNLQPVRSLSRVTARRHSEGDSAGPKSVSSSFPGSLTENLGLASRFPPGSDVLLFNKKRMGVKGGFKTNSFGSQFALRCFSEVN